MVLVGGILFILEAFTNRRSRLVMSLFTSNQDVYNHFREPLKIPAARALCPTGTSLHTLSYMFLGFLQG